MQTPNFFLRAAAVLATQKPESVAQLAEKADANGRAAWTKAMNFKYKFSEGRRTKSLPPVALNLLNAAYEECEGLHDAYVAIGLGARAYANRVNQKQQFAAAGIQACAVLGRDIMDVWGHLEAWSERLSISEAKGAAIKLRSEAETSAQNQQEDMQEWVAKRYPKGLLKESTELLIEQTKLLMPRLPDRIYELAAEVLNNPVRQFSIPPATPDQPDPV